MITRKEEDNVIQIDRTEIEKREGKTKAERRTQQRKRKETDKKTLRFNGSRKDYPRKRRRG